MKHPIDRFQSREAQIDAMLAQKIIPRDGRSIATALVEAGELIALEPGEEIITQEGIESDAFFLLFGSVELFVKDRLLKNRRYAGEVVGEFTAINNRLRRTATVRAAEQSVALKVSSNALISAGDAQPGLWRLLAVDLTFKVEQRNQYIANKNDRPAILIVASEERSPVADEIHLALSSKNDVRIFSDNDIFAPGLSPLEKLHEQAFDADFAVVLAHPDDLKRSAAKKASPQPESLLFELGYLMSLLGRHRTVLLIPRSDTDVVDAFRGLDPLCYAAPDGRPMRVLMAPVVDQLQDYIDKRKVRSRIEPNSANFQSPSYDRG